MKVILGSDCIGFQLKRRIAEALAEEVALQDVGVESEGDDSPYPEIALRAAEAVARGDAERAILVCGTGLGMAISANKVRGIRAVTAYDAYSVERSVLSNNCQVLGLGSRVVGPELAVRVCRDWLRLRFDPSSPSAAKVAVLSHYESEHADSIG